MIFATGLLIYGVLYIAARFIPWILPGPESKWGALGFTAACVVSWTMMLVSLVELATRYLP